METLKYYYIYNQRNLIASRIHEQQNTHTIYLCVCVFK